jgi:hypothetical protein
MPKTGSEGGTVGHSAVEFVALGVKPAYVEDCPEGVVFDVARSSGHTASSAAALAAAPEPRRMTPAYFEACLTREVARRSLSRVEGLYVGVEAGMLGFRTSCVLCASDARPAAAFLQQARAVTKDEGRG